MLFKVIKLSLWFGITFFLGYIFVGTVFAQSIELSGNSGQVRNRVKQPIDEMKCTAGYCQLEGTLFVDPSIGAKRFELPETSTPTVKANKALIWLQVEGSSQTIKVLFEDGTIKNLISNKTP